MKNYKAKDIIKLYLTFLRTVPNGQKQWDTESLKDVPGTIVLVEKINALLHAFSIRSVITVLKKGYFIPHLPFFRRKMYAIKIMTNRYIDKELDRFYSPDEKIRNFSDDFVWVSLIYLLRNIPFKPKKYYYFRGGNDFPEILYDDILSKLNHANPKKTKKRVYKILSAFIDPWDRKISKEKLIRKYGFPE